MSLIAPLWERLIGRPRKRPLTRKELFFRGLFILVIVGDIVIISFGSWVVNAIFFAPKNLTIPQHIGFALPGTPYNAYQVDTFVTIKANSTLGYQFFVYERIHVRVDHAFVNEGGYQKAEALYFSFENAQLYNAANGCVLGEPPLGILLTKYREGISPVFRGEGDICFPYGGSFVPVFVVKEANKEPIRLHEGVGGSFSLNVASIERAEEIVLNLLNLVLTVELSFFGILESYHVASALYPKGFPKRFEYKHNHSHHLDSQPDLSQSKPNVMPTPKEHSQEEVGHQDAHPKEEKASLDTLQSGEVGHSDDPPKSKNE